MSRTGFVSTAHLVLPSLKGYNSFLKRKKTWSFVPKTGVTREQKKTWRQTKNRLKEDIRYFVASGFPYQNCISSARTQKKERKEERKEEESVAG